MPRSSSNGAKRRVRQFRNRPARPGTPGTKLKGRLLIIGGHEDKEDSKLILRQLANLVGNGMLVIGWSRAPAA